MANSRHQAEEHKSNSLYTEEYSSNYRKYDEEYTKEKDYLHFTGRLKMLTRSFGYEVAVLDVGCGTGRYFHALKNTYHLTGIDISAAMLSECKQPLYSDQISIRELRLKEGNIFMPELTEATFDFIYSIGVLGEHVPFDQETALRIYSLLKPGGKAYFTIVDLESRKSSLRKTVDFFYPLLPAFLKKKLDARWKINYMTKKQLTAVLDKVPLLKYEIHTHRSEGKGWQGLHFECVLNK